MNSRFVVAVGGRHICSDLITSITERCQSTRCCSPAAPMIAMASAYGEGSSSHTPCRQLFGLNEAIIGAPVAKKENPLLFVVYLKTKSKTDEEKNSMFPDKTTR